MFKLAWRGVLHNTGRYVATLIAIMTGVAFFAATGFLGDRVVDSVEGDTRRQFEVVDIAVTPVPPDEDAAFSLEEGLDLRLAKDTVDQIEALPGVQSTGRVLTGQVALVDEEEEATAIVGRLWIEDDELNPLDVIEGSAPTAAGEIAIDRDTADDRDLSVGDTTTVLSFAGSQPVTITGITEFGSNASLDPGGTISIPAEVAFDQLTDGLAEYQEVYLRSDSSDELLTSVQELIPGGFEALDGATFLNRKIDEIGTFANILKRGLQGFAVLSILVGAFVIYNTFSVIVSQRIKELAVLRAIGSTPKQIKRALRFEGLVVGILGSILGVLAGLGFVFLIDFILSNFLNVNLPGSGLVIRPATVVNALLLGTLVTVLSVMIPARRAATTEPIEALRDAAVESSPFGKKRIIFAAVTGLLGLAGVFLGSTLTIVGIGLVLTFVAAIAAGPFIAVLFAKLAKPLMSPLGLEGRLAVDNTARNPQRTATTANALLIGVFLVTLVTVAGTSLKDFVVSEIQQFESADYLLASNGGSLDPDVLDRAGSVDGVDNVVPFRRQTVSRDETPTLVSTIDLVEVLEVSDLKIDTGSFDDIAPGKAVVPDSFDSNVGDSVSVENRLGETLTLEVVGTLATTIDSAFVGTLLDRSDFDTLVGDIAPTVAFIDVARGGRTDTETALEDIANERPDVTLTAGNTLGKLIGSIFDFMINAVNGLLGMSVLVAVIGIINTLSLSIFERRRELGLLRVVGMVDRRVQRMVRLESVLIATLGTVVGVVLGIFVSWGLLNAIERTSDTALGFSWAPGRLVLIIIAGFVLGVAASLIPARRSTRLEVLDAIQAS